MNERILELAEAADQLAEDELVNLERVHNRLYSFTESREIYNQKFAELIVKECAETIRVSMIKHCTGVVLNTDYNRGLSKASTSIKEHFGVEE